MGNTMGRATSPIASIYESPVNQYVADPTRQQVYSEGEKIFGTSVPGAANMGNGYGQDGGYGIPDILGGNNWLQTLGAGTGIAKDLFGLYAMYQGMDMAKTGLNNQTKTSNYNMANNTNFINGTIDAFGSGQKHTQNQFGSMV